MPVSLQLRDEYLDTAAISTASAESAARSTTKALESLFLMSNTLRQRAEVAAAGLEAIPRTNAVKHALMNNLPS